MSEKVVPIRKEPQPPMVDGMTEHLFSYYDAVGVKFSISVWARDEAEARDRFVRASAGNFDGIVYETRPL
jgi:hypothetical protein